MSREQEYKEIISANLNMALASGFIPELGEHSEGKVRDNHFTGDKVFMVASDRVSSFDHVLSRLIPFKGYVLNAFNAWAMEIARDIGIPIAMLDSPDPNVIVQQRMENSGFECIVRAFVWGSLASDYEDGLRQKSGIPLPNGLIRYQRLDEPIFTPSTKAGIGHHDQDITLEDMIKVLGPENAMKIKGYSISLFREGAFRARAKGKHLIDTKFEFGFDKEKGLWLIDESLSPDSSRYCSKAEYDEKFPKIVEAMRTGNYKDVSALLKERPELKIREDSKQFVRDVLIEGGYKEGSIPDLTDEQIIETAWRYIDTYEKLTGKTFDFAQSDLPTAEKRVMNNLKKAGMVYGGCVVPMLASEKDMPHWEKLEKELKGAGVPFVKPFFGSAHKETLRVLEYIGKMDQSIEPLVFITSAGRSDGLGPTVAANTRYPTIACNPYSDIATYMVDIHSSTRMPSNLPLMVVVEPGNAALAAKRMIDLAK